MVKKSYKDLDVWKKAVDFAEHIYMYTAAFPQREHYGLSSQIRKSAVSIASNIAEGAAQHSDKEFIQFLVIARGSSAELQTQLLIASRRKFLERDHYVSLTKELNEIGKMMSGLLSNLRDKN